MESALHVAVQNNWGGPSSSDKKDWFAGAVSELLASRPDTDQEDLEAFLLQIMQDEFDCNVEDESEVATARDIWALKRCLAGEIEGTSDRLAAFKELERRFRNRGHMKTTVEVVDNGPQEEVGDDDEEWNGFGDGDGDVDMTAGEEAVPNLVPAVVQKKEKKEPEVDDDGFTKVTRKR
ncbi:rRNA accumulation-related protein [Recurvomyces mirabilis]|uniref:rRNA accumulation-related protein n=1 Tax=Recurvomyces mirabilis TaxID=574656 RepID=A0AAE0WVS0_9PEZI|nr:rRNA accumulation-related protein [Recurvomyces mirabilis]KAK5158661.1 rRNA accumulation- protein [Recurvomyces mirabilis]